MSVARENSRSVGTFESEIKSSNGLCLRDDITGVDLAYMLALVWFVTLRH